MKAATRMAWLVGLLLTGLAPQAGVAQTGWSELQWVRWPLLDMVLVPDSAGVWLVVGPNPATQQWESGSQLVDVCVDPVLVLQWATVARGLTSARTLTPPLRDRRDRKFVILALNPRKASEDQRFVLVASDSGSKVHWKSFASRTQVESMLDALERAATAARAGVQTFSGDVGHSDPDTPVRVLDQPQPRYPRELAIKNQIGRVWMSYVVGADGRPVQGSLRPLLADDSLFAAAAIKALMGSRFKPALLNNQPVAQRVFQAIMFRTR